LTVEHVENVGEMTRHPHHVLDSLPLLAGASRAEKSSAGDVVGVCNHARTERERENLLHRIGPSESTLFIAKTDGFDEHPLLPNSGFDYNGSFSPDRKWIIFTSERGGSADIYRVHPDGSGLERLTDDPAYDDQGALSPDGKQLAFVSSLAGRYSHAGKGGPVF
jgi:hypothetical protein